MLLSLWRVTSSIDWKCHKSGCGSAAGLLPSICEALGPIPSSKEKKKKTMKGKHSESKIHWTPLIPQTSQLSNTAHCGVKDHGLPGMLLTGTAQHGESNYLTTFHQSRTRSKLEIWSTVYSECVYHSHTTLSGIVISWDCLFSLGNWIPLLTTDSPASDLSPVSDSCSSRKLAWLPQIRNEAWAAFLCLPTK